jgi:NitT/TauT family transport system substrate-binding protein
MNSNALEKELKIPVDWQYFSTGPEMMQAFYRNELDAGYVGLTPAMIGIEKGVPIKCAAGGHIEGTIFCGSPKFQEFDQVHGGIMEVFTQFIDKTIGTPKQGSIHSVILNYYLHKFNLHEKIAVRYYDDAEVIALDIFKGKIDAGMGTPALATYAECLGPSKILIPPNQLWPYNPSYGVFFHNDIIENNPDIVEAFLYAHIEAEETLRKHPQEAAKAIARIFNIKDVLPEYFERVIRISPKYCALLDNLYIESSMGLMREMVKLGYLKGEIDVERVFYPNLIRKIHPEPAHYNPIQTSFKIK